MDDFSSGSGSKRVSIPSACVDIVIVNWNAGEQLAQCVASVARFVDGAIADVILVDNASTDGSVDGLEAFHLSLQVIRNAENLGFARACNQGATFGSAPYILFLNPDTCLFEGSIQTALAFLETPEKTSVGICGIQLLDENNRVARTCARFPTLARLSAQALGLNKLPGCKSLGTRMKAWDHSKSRTVDQVIGAFFLVRRRVFDALQGFDERYFVYFEEVDFSYRARLINCKSVYLSEAQAFHAGGGTSRQVKAARLFYSLRSRLLYGFKHFPLWQAWALMGVTLLIEPVARFSFCAIQGQWKSVRNTMHGYRLLWGALPDLLRSKRKGS